MADEEILQLSENPVFNVHTWELEGTIELRRRIENFKGGKVVVSVPSAPFKCPPGLYETACLLDEFFRKKGVTADIFVVDSNDKPQPPPLAQKWLTVFEKKNIKYMPNNKVVDIDGANKQLITDKGDKIGYDLVTLIPPNKASTVIKESGLGDPFVDVDPTTFKSKKFGNIFATAIVQKSHIQNQHTPPCIRGKTLPIMRQWLWDTAQKNLHQFITSATHIHPQPSQCL